MIKHSENIIALAAVVSVIVAPGLLEELRTIKVRKLPSALSFAVSTWILRDLPWFSAAVIHDRYVPTFHPGKGC